MAVVMLVRLCESEVGKKRRKGAGRWGKIMMVKVEKDDAGGFRTKLRGGMRKRW